jgi:hypothetical protein
MRYTRSKNFMLSVTGAALLCLGLLGSNEAAALSVAPSASLDGIPTAGAPSFNFNESSGDYSNTIENWSTNIVFVDAHSSGYTLYAYSEGDFTYWEDPTTSYSGKDGLFNLRAEFNLDGSFNASGTNTISITGIIPGVVDTNMELMSADLTDFNFANNLVGFATNNIVCAPGIINCQNAESVYFYTAENFPDIGSLTNDYQTTMASKTTVPVPAAAWLMLSALGLLGTFAQRQKRAAA